MTATTYPEFNPQTESLQVAQAFSDNIRGKTILVTGLNIKGIGFTTAEAFASQSPAHLVLTGRNVAKVQECVDALKAKFPGVKYHLLKLDLSSQQAVRAAATEFNSWTSVPSLDIIVNSAGVMNVPERTITEDGLELQFATNHIGHYLFTCLIMPKLFNAASKNPKGATRIINVSSLSPTSASMRWSDLNFEKINHTLPEAEQPPYQMHRAFGAVDPENKSYLPLEGYNQSKVANLLFSIAINNRLYEKFGILSLALHPGVIKTELSRDAPPETMKAILNMVEMGHINLITQGAGASTSLVAALDPKLGPGEARDGKENFGVYLADCQISDKALPRSESNSEAEKLWKVSEELVKESFAW